jgi:hypothetical protein
MANETFLEKFLTNAIEQLNRLKFYLILAISPMLAPLLKASTASGKARVKMRCKTLFVMLPQVRQRIGGGLPRQTTQSTKSRSLVKTTVSETWARAALNISIS